MKPTPDRFERWRKSREKGGLSLKGAIEKGVFSLFGSQA